MGVFNENAKMGAAGAGGDYDIDNSVRFNRSESPTLSKTFASAGNRRTWTFSVWVKLGDLDLGGQLGIFGAYTSNSDTANIQLDGAGGEFHWEHYAGSYAGGLQVTKRVLRDPSNWYHLMIAYDTTQSTASNRIKLYINGTHHTELVTGGSHGQPAQNYEGKINTATEHLFGKVNGTYHFDGYMAEAYFIDGTAYAPTAFGEVDEDYGHWKPIKFEGTYGSNGFYLDFKNASSLGNDANGSNNFAVNNISSHDQTTDTPTNNFAVINSIEDVYPPSDDSATTVSEGNLRVTNTANAAACMRRATFGMDSGKWYWEVLRNNTSGSETGTTLGIMPAAAGLGTTSNYIGASGSNEKGGIGFYGSGSTSGLNNGGTINGDMSAQAANSVIMFAYDCATGKMWVGYNGTWRSSGNPATGANPWATFTDTVVTKSPAFQYHNNVEYVVNFGQEGTFTGRKTAGGNSDDNGYGNFLYDVPAGFLALCSKNLPEPAVKPKEHFKTVLYTGNGSTNAVTGTGFTPGLTWIRARNSSNYNAESYDIARGATYSQALASNGVEYQHSNTLGSFDSNGFTLGAHAGINNNGTTFVSWNWKMGGSPSSNSNGSITTNVSANQSAGQSVLTYSGTGTTATLGHGLSDTPDLILLKVRNFSASGQGWVVGTDAQEPKKLHSGTFDMTDTGNLDSTSVWVDETIWMDGANLNNITFSVEGGHPRCNVNTYNYLAYCFHNVEGYQKIGGYDSGAGGAEDGVGGAISGTFVYTGFRPAMVYIKAFDKTQQWVTVDSTRQPHNKKRGSGSADGSRQVLYLSTVNTETVGEGITIDFCANGFKCRERDSWFNDYRYCYFYYAVAEYPFKYSNAG
tara:strand:- start:2054 stop:4618 length:2565 start_codon:yes stop_codon:yes gene_type:complete